MIQYFEFEIGKNEIIFKYNQKQNDNSEKPIISVKNGLWIGERTICSENRSRVENEMKKYLNNSQKENTKEKKRKRKNSTKIYDRWKILDIHNKCIN